MFKGVYTALVTPFKNGVIDYKATDVIIDRQVDGGVSGIVPMGTTGESPTVSVDEHEEFIRHVVKRVNGKIKIIAGTGANSTVEAIHLSKSAQDAGVDGVLQVNPYYNRPSQDGLIAHFEAVSNSIDVPVMLYNIPGRSAVNFLPDSVVKLLDRTDNIKAMKEASGDISQMMRLIELCGDRIDILSGDDNLTLPLMAVGGHGVVSVLSNILPQEVVSVVDLYNDGKISESKELFYRLLPVSRSMFFETNPVPVKTAMALMGLCSDDMRLPMVPMGKPAKEMMISELKKFGMDV